MEGSMIEAFKDFSKNRRVSDNKRRSTVVKRRFEQEKAFYSNLTQVDAQTIESVPKPESTEQSIRASTENI